MPAATIVPRLPRVVASVLALLVLAGCAPTSTTATMRSAQPEYAPGFNGVPVDYASEIPQAQFTDDDGEPFDLRAAMRERPTLMYFGYTHCPDICPVHLANIATAMENTSIGADQINVVFVSADPRRDTPEVLHDYLAAFDASFIGLWAPQAQVDAFMGGLGLPPPVMENPSGSEQYTVGHPGQVLAFDTTGRARIAYPFGTRQSQWAQDLPRLAREDWS